ncbi:hypothetical protein [Agrobacterium tumefaciens]|uniref:hypothetical protein n=1 Tax=Agrobacterium tumefaciens TaxID=358 RepID=UPI0015717F34|nr:hypothetical protein [Agrobacterium tumefaciens]NSX92642.1 hypothetical protein [Agrobacterium tumefaciens]NSX92703.1 hypothetical protein [Agrobacterium tumefaciens]
MKKSIITRRGVVPSIHRWVYANGWHAAAAFGLVACLAFPFSPVPSACLFFLAVGLAAIRVFVDFLERLITVIEEDAARDERMESFLRPPSLYDQQIRRENVDSIRSSGSDLEDWTYGLGKYAEPDEE